MADQHFIGKTIFIDVGKGSEPYKITVSPQSKPEPIPDESDIKTEAVNSSAETPQPSENLSLVIQSRPFKCPECPRYSAEYQEKLDRHIKRRHRGENPFNCYMCEYSTYNKTMFEEHIYIHQGIKPYKCSYCDHASVSKKNMKKHELRHRPDHPLRCKKCPFIGQNQFSLRKHLSKECESSVEDDKPVSHNLRFKSHKCKPCGYSTKFKTKLDNHLKSCTGSKDDKFNCKVCKWSSKHDAKILLHLIHHPNQEVDETVIDISILRKHGIMV